MILTILASHTLMPSLIPPQASNTMNIRWYNKMTQEWSWEDPKAKSHWKPVTNEADGKTYYFNIVTGESQGMSQSAD